MNNVDTIKQTNRKHTSKKKKLEKQISSGSSSENENYKNPTQPEEEPLIGGRFEYKKLLVLGSGTFGEIYIGFDTINKEFVALKIEKLTAKMNQQLKNEKNVIEMMYPTEGFPRVIDYGPYYDSNYLAIDLLGPSLLDMFEYCGYRFTLQTVLLVGYQMIQRIQELHSKNFIHRDIKPENFLIGTGTKSNVVYLVDFGLAHRYKDPKTMEHIIYRETKEMTGTARYASINNLLGVEQSRRDDLEAIGYVLIYFLKRRLPWQGVQGTSMNDKCKKILDKKLAISVENLCKDLPIEFSTYISYCRNLRFDQRPDYNFLKGLFSNLLFKTYNEDFYFDWYFDLPIIEAPNRKDYNETIKNKIHRAVTNNSNTKSEDNFCDNHIVTHKINKIKKKFHINLEHDELNSNDNIKEKSFDKSFHSENEGEEKDEQNSKDSQNKSMSSEEEEDKLLEVLDFTREKKDEQNYKGSQNKSKTLKEEEKIIEVPDFTRYLNKNIQRSITNFKEETSKNRKGKIIKMIGVGDPSQDIPTIFKKMNSSRNLLPKLKIIEEAHNEEIDNTKSSIRKR